MRPRPAERRAAAAPPIGRTSETTLPAWKAFAVQFSRDAGSGSDRFSGRVEHLHSGRRARFGSRQELLEVLRHLLGAIEATSR